MGITRKKDLSAAAIATGMNVDERQIDALISKGGSVTQENRKKVDDGKKTHPLLLNVPLPLIDDIDVELEHSPAYFRKKRTLYILQAIEEKILRDRKKRK